MFVNRDDARISYWALGKGPAIVLLHPFPANHEFWMPVAEVLSQRYRVILPDLRGHGGSEPGVGSALMSKHVEDVVRICEQEAVKRAVFMGCSIGGYILFEFWRRERARVVALGLCDTRASADTPQGKADRLKSADEVQQKGPAEFLEQQAHKLVGKTTQQSRPDLFDAAHAMMKKMSVAGIVNVQRGMAERPDSIPTLKTIDAPTFILVGEEDIVTPPADSELMQREIAGSQLARIAKAGHYAAFERPQDCAPLLRNFVDSLKWS
jgi:pimeloyl-ACP methyl ester carboxylesterase